MNRERNVSKAAGSGNCSLKISPASMLLLVECQGRGCADLSALAGI
jgi:hypothetical protein